MPRKIKDSSPEMVKCPGEPLVYFVSINRLRNTYSAFRTEHVQKVECELKPLPLRVVQGDDGCFEIIDGFKRFAMWLDEGRSPVPIIIESPGPRSDHKRLLLLANKPRRSLSAFDEACVVESLIREDGLTPGAAAKLLGRKKAWVMRCRAFVQHLSDAAQQKLAHGRLGITQAELLTSIAPEDQDALLKAAEQQHLTGAQQLAFFHAWRLSETSSEKNRLLKNPLGTLQPQASSHLSLRSQAFEQRLRRISEALEDLKTARPPEDMPPAEGRRLHALYRSVCAEIRQCAQSLHSVFTATTGGSSMYQETIHANCNTPETWGLGSNGT